MKNRNIKFPFLVMLLLTLLLFSCRKSPDQQSPNDHKVVNFEPEYVLLDRDGMIANADIILLGKVKNLSPTQWNQDSGEYWEEVTEDGVSDKGEILTTSFSAWPVHRVQLKVLQILVDEIGIGDELTLTVLGKGPQDPPDMVFADGITLQASVPYSLQIGDQIMVFAIQTEMAWRDPSQPIRLLTNADGSTYFDIGKRTIFDFISAPANSFLIAGEQALYYSTPDATFQEEPVSVEQLILEVSEKRTP